MLSKKQLIWSIIFSSYGTALGVVRKLHELKRLEHVYCTETRPYNQGARLTAFELVHDKIPATLILDSMVAVLFRIRNIAAVVVGADRVAANGDTANKIGTYQIAVAAKYHGVPFYVAAPLTSIDLGIPSGDRIVIEERPDREMTHVGEHRIAAPGNSKFVYNKKKCLVNFVFLYKVSHVGIQHLMLHQLVLSKLL